MGKFHSRWMQFEPGMPGKGTDRTDKRKIKELETCKPPTAKTDKRASVGSVGPQVGHSAEKQWRELTPTEQQAEAAKFDERGWLAIHSEHLGEVIILARDEQAAENAPAGFVTYTGEEVGLLLGTTPDALRQVHEAKKFWNGRITGKEVAN